MISALVEYVVHQLVENPTHTAVRIEHAENALIVHITIDQKERGKIIGRDGQTIKALRAFLGALVPENTHITIELMHPA